VTRLSAATTVAAPVARAFELAADFTRLAEWDPNVAHSALSSGAPLEQGAVIDVGARFLGATARLRYELTAVDAPRFVEYVGRGRTVTTTDRIVFSNTGSGTRIEFTADIGFHGYGMLLKPVVVLVSRRQARAALAGLAARLG
jgi:dehydrogenase/reductase SDR family protein 12